MQEEFRIVCSSCGYEQVVGNFCGICGNKLEEPTVIGEKKSFCSTGGTKYSYRKSEDEIETI